MQKLQESVFSIVKTTSLSPSVFSFLQPTEECPDALPLGGILSDTRHGWLALGPKFCVVNLKSGLKIAARVFGASLSNLNTTVTSVVELPTPLTENSTQLLISLQCEDIAGIVCVFHVNGSQILRCIQTEIVVTELAVCDSIPDGPLACFDGVVMAGTKSGEVFAFDLHRACLIQALKDISQGYEHLVRSETNASHLTFLPLKATDQIEEQRDLALENDDHIAILLNENSLVDGQYYFRNPDDSVRMKAKRDHIKICSLLYIPQLGSLAVGYNFGAFQIWNMMSLDLEFTSQHNVDCLPVTHFGFQEPCDDPRAFCYLWVVFSLLDRFEEEVFPLAIMYSLTYQGKRMLSDTKYLYQDFSTATIRFQLDLCPENSPRLVGGRCVACNTYSVNSTLGDEGEDSMLNLCQIVWECWTMNPDVPTKYGMLLFDLDQWYKDQMPATYPLQSNAFMSAICDIELGSGPCLTLNVQLEPNSVSMYWHATRLDEHFYPNSLQCNCMSLNTSEVCVLSTVGVQRQIISSIDEIGPTILLNPTPLYNACVSAGLTPLYMDIYARYTNQEEQRRYLLSVALEARLTRFLERCAHDWATGSHVGFGCTMEFMMDWGWKRALELKENAKELTAPLFASSSMPDRNVVRCLEHCVQQLTQLTSLLSAAIKKCSNLIVPDVLTELQEQHKGIGAVSLYFRVAAWCLRVGLLPETEHGDSLSYPRQELTAVYNKRRIKLHRLQDSNLPDDEATKTACKLLYIDQLIENEFGGDKIHQMWIKGGSENNGLYPPPSLYSLLRLYLLPDISEEHKHSLVLYLLVDYSMIYDEIRYEAIIRRLMQFPTMFGLSNTAIKATQAFWHLDHRDFDFALDQLQCLTGNLLSDWQHNVVLSSLLAQKKTQAALQYLHVRKPPPIQNLKDKNLASNQSNDRIYDHDKLEDWESCCNLYLARGLVYEALDVVRMCVNNLNTVKEKTDVLNYFYKGCRNSGQLSKILQVTLSTFEEEIFINYLKSCNEPQTSDILVMYYLLQARYIEAQEYNNKLKRSTIKDNTLDFWNLDSANRAANRDALVAVECACLPSVTNATVFNNFLDCNPVPKVVAPEPMSVIVQAKSPKNTFTYKSTFIQDAIDSASEIWINKPNTRKGLKRALNIEEIPFLCTPKLVRTKSIFSPDRPSDDVTPSKRPKFDLSTASPKTPKTNAKISENLSMQMSQLLEMPDIQSPAAKYNERSGAETPHSILKVRRADGLERELSPASSRYLDSDDDMSEIASQHSHYSDSANKHLRFTIPMGSATPSPETALRAITPEKKETETQVETREKGMDVSIESYATTASHPMNEQNPLESPPKKIATEDKVKCRKSYKDTVRSRRSLSISANSSLSDNPNTSIESIADIPITLINPRYSSERRRHTPEKDIRRTETQDTYVPEGERERVTPPKTPQGRRGIRSMGKESTPLATRSRSVTPERQDSPVVTPLRPLRMTRSRSRTPEISPRSSPLEIIEEQPKQETESEPHPAKTTLSIPRPRSRSRTPERLEKAAKNSPRLEAISESLTPPGSPTTRSLRSRSRTPERTEKLALESNLEALKETSKVESPASPRTRSQRSRSRTPEIEIVVEDANRPSSPRLRSRSKTPELLSPKKDRSTRTKKPLSRMVLEANAFKQISEKQEMETETSEPKGNDENVIACTPMKSNRNVPSLMDVTFSPIANKSVLHTSNESEISMEKDANSDTSNINLKTLPAFTVNETGFAKSVLESCESSEVSESIHDESNKLVAKVEMKSFKFTTINETGFGKSVLHSYESSVGESSYQESSTTAPKNKGVIAKTDESQNESTISHSVLKGQLSSLLTSDSDIDTNDDKNSEVIQKEKNKIVEIEREIDEIEGDMLNSDNSSDEDDDDGIRVVEEESESDEAKEDDEEEQEEEETDNDNANASDEEISSDDNEVISIGDSSDESGSGRLQIDEGSKDSNIKDKADEQASKPKTLEIDDKTYKEVNTNEQLATSKDTKATIISESDTQKPAEAMFEVDVDIKQMETESVEAETDPLNPANFSIMTEDNSVHSDQEMKLTYDDEEQMDTTMVGEDTAKPTISEAKIEDTETLTSTKPTADSVNPLDINIRTLTSQGQEDTELKESTQPLITEKEIKSSDKTNIKDNKPASRTRQRVKSTSSNSSTKSKEGGVKTLKDIETNESLADDKDNKKENIAREKAPLSIGSQDASSTKTSKVADLKESLVPNIDSPMTRKRAKSISSNKSTDGKTSSENKDTEIKESLGTKIELQKEKVSQTSKNTEVPNLDEPKTPMTRKRAKSISSNKSEDDKTTPENKEIVTRARSKTPTSGEVRRIMTRRASKEAEKMDDTMPLDETLTPRRRSARTRSKNDDNESVASEASVRSTRSTRSKASEDNSDIKPASVRKGRKSILKTDLPAIPEVISEESRDKSELMKEYSSARRLTRNQKAVLERLESLPTPTRPRRAASRASGASIDLADDDDNSSVSESTDAQSMDRMLLLNKGDFEGAPDSEELDTSTIAESIASSASKERRARMGRAASETKSTPKTKPSRRISVDIVQSESPTASPLRGRRASFNKAIEALHTPKGRRQSTDKRTETDSRPESPASSEVKITPARRTRKGSSTSTPSHD